MTAKKLILINGHLSYPYQKSYSKNKIDFLFDVYNLFKNHPHLNEQFKETIYHIQNRCRERNFGIWESFMGFSGKNKSMKEVCLHFNITSERVKQIFGNLVRAVRRFIFDLNGENMDEFSRNFHKYE